ncbi:hypothetical protein TVAG_269010 [Trichomonas vaginalis G3]|uniref:Eukaryotic initiation factor 4E family protein n=1 Tax=Trichomonas vaginalis (strain ATCC PRA-98 / G3) TaxID=412133 RepID=A2EG14_TRIV3|nr:translation initiation factor protein [Trichomonas vaginalis G3]EAY08375.1 hypothetical protein TVAG_269010 [Trichomonas vaginalis G3]KAI5499345.1 translation initiation factor protein [Trichomonas vaginalis G3]|eukprot:XP_001320598.1 hypothetical protein [Trichomonas vaginalis G3]
MAASSTNVLPETWQFWVVLNAVASGQKIYQIEKIFAFNTVENFWSYQEALPKVSDFKNVNNKKVSLALFRGEIQPAWEDPANAKGATYVLTVPNTAIDEFWETLILFMIGGQMQRDLFDGEPEVCGLFVRNIVSAEFAVEIWTRSDIDRRIELLDYVHENICPQDSAFIRLKEFHTHVSKTTWN